MISRLLNQKIERKNKRPIMLDYFFNPQKNKLPLVIFCHGYKGFKDWGAWPLVAENMAKNDIFFIKFNFSHNGTSATNPTEFVNTDAFAENTYSKEIEDLNNLIDHIKNCKYKAHIDMEQINLIGHSRGGGIVLLNASQRKDISKIITWASVSDFERRFEINSDSFKQWKSSGIKFIENKRTGQQLPHKFTFFEDFVKNKNQLDINKAVKSLTKPVLLIHGDNDDAVNVKESKELHKLCNTSQLKIIQGANHVFNAKHPWIENQLPKALNIVTKHSIAFIKQKSLTF